MRFLYVHFLWRYVLSGNFDSIYSKIISGQVDKPNQNLDQLPL